MILWGYANILFNILFLLKFLPTNFSIHQWDFPAEITTVVFYFFHFCYIYFWNSILKKSYPHLFIYSVIYSQHGYLFYSLGYHPLLLFTALLKLPQLWSWERFKDWLLYSLHMSSSQEASKMGTACPTMTPVFISPTSPDLHFDILIRTNSGICLLCLLNCSCLLVMSSQL